MSIDEPTFSYANGALDDAETLQRRAQDAVMRKALAAAGEHAATQAAIISEAKAHVWEHKQGDASGKTAKTFQRLFTREEVFFCAGAAAMAAREGQDLVAAVNRAIARLDGGK